MANFSSHFCEIQLFCIVFTICDLVHDVKKIFHAEISCNSDKISRC